MIENILRWNFKPVDFVTKQAGGSANSNMLSDRFFIQIQLLSKQSMYMISFKPRGDERPAGINQM